MYVLTSAEYIDKWRQFSISFKSSSFNCFTERKVGQDRPNSVALNGVVNGGFSFGGLVIKKNKNQKPHVRLIKKLFPRKQP